MTTRESNLVSFARSELARLRDGEADEMQEAMEAHVLKMVQEFADEGHSGFSAAYAVGILEKVLRFQPLTPLTGEDDEWMQISDEPCWQNRRSPRVFKDASGAYDIDGRVFVEPSGAAFTGRGSRVPVTFPYVPKTEYVRVDAEGNPLPDQAA